MKVALRRVLIVCSLISSVNSYAQWIQTGPQEGYVKVRYSLGTKVFGFNGDSLLVSDSVDENWTTVKATTGSQIYSYGITGTPDGRLYTYGRLGVYVSPDTGKSWFSASNGLELDGSPFSHGYHINGCLTKGNNIFLGYRGTPANGVNGRIYRSTDGANSWKVVYTGNGAYGNSLTIGASANSIFISHEANSKSKYYRSKDDGATWTEFGQSVFPYAAPYCVLATPTKTLFGTANGILSSTDEGESFTQNGLQNLAVASLHISQNILHAATNKGLFTSVDNGTSWKQSDFFDSTMFLTSVATFNNRLYVESLDATFISSDGINWERSYAGSSPIAMECLRVIGRNIFAIAEYPNKVALYRSINAGKSWIQLSAQVPDWLINSPDPVLYADYDSVIRKSVDLGATWTATTVPPNIKEIIRYKDRLLTADRSAVYVSSDDGATWQARSLGLQNLTTNVVADSMYQYVGGYKTIYRSAHGEELWYPYTTNEVHTTLLYFHNTLFLGTSQTNGNVSPLLTSTDQAEHWVRMPGLATKGSIITGLKVLHDTILAIVDGRLKRSTDDGTTWESIPIGSGTINDFAVEDETIYLAAKQGIWKNKADKNITKRVANKHSAPLALNAYPNPCDVFATIALPEIRGQVRVEIRDLLGTIVPSAYTQSDEQLTIATRGIPNGCYLVSLRAGERSYQVRLIVNH